MESAGTFSLFIPSFTPAEVERIANVPPVQVRDWRRRKLLRPSKGPGWNRFDPFDVAHLMAIKVLADRGIGPTASQEGDVAKLIAVGILMHVLNRGDAYGGDFRRALEWLDPETLAELKKPTDPARLAQLQAFLKDAYDIGPDILDMSNANSFWKHQRKWLQQQVWRAFTRGQELPEGPYWDDPVRYFIWWGNGEHVLTQSLSKTFNEMWSFDPKLSAAMVLLDLDALASTFLDRADRPLVHVQFDFETDHQEEPPIKERVAHVMRGLEPALTGSVFEQNGSLA